MWINCTAIHLPYTGIENNCFIQVTHTAFCLEMQLYLFLMSAEDLFAAGDNRNNKHFHDSETEVQQKQTAWTTTKQTKQYLTAWFNMNEHFSKV